MSLQKIIKTGNSAAVTIPSDFIKAVGTKIGDQVKVEVHPETGQVVYFFKGTKQLPLSQSFLTKSRRGSSRKK
jgi:bifunctional DNA-binding transcriptional regulator/antitoxin component of YhaV-PrlF toxin-antitoxin module